MKKKGIFIKEWLDFKPYNQQVATDRYYIGLANKLRLIIEKQLAHLGMTSVIDAAGISLIACVLSSYLEDVVSKNLIWGTFINKHKELYQKVLPFFELEGYIEGEINLQDVSFLIWYLLNTIQQDQFVTSRNSFIFELGAAAFELLEKEWEYAPENEDLEKAYYIPEDEKDYYLVREKIDNFLFHNYLTYSDTAFELRDSEEAILEKHKKVSPDWALSFLNDNRDEKVSIMRTRLLALKGKEWMAEMVGKEHPLYQDLLDISPRVVGLFAYEGEEENYYLLKYMATGRMFKLLKSSFEETERIQKPNSLVAMGMVNWKGDWWFSGNFLSVDYNEELVAKDQATAAAKNRVAFLDFDEVRARTEMANQTAQYKAFNHGHDLAFMPEDQVDEFIEKGISYFNAIKLDATSQPSLGPDFSQQKVTKEEMEAIKSPIATVFFNPNSGIEVGLKIQSAFPLGDWNPYFNPEQAREHILRLLLDESASGDIAKLCFNHYKEQLPFFESVEGKMLGEDLDFIIRFFKRKNYYSKPNIVFVNKDNAAKQNTTMA